MQESMQCLLPNTSSKCVSIILGNLKITDFGLATVFRFKERERLLDRCCGTPPYVAPEVCVKVIKYLFATPLTQSDQLLLGTEFLLMLR